MFPLLLFLIALNTSPTWATNSKTGDFKEEFCSQCQQWCAVAIASSCGDADAAGVLQFNIPVVGVKNVFCDVADDGGKWTVFQRRMNGNVDFYRGWNYYVFGFGDLRGDHWLGLEAMHQMTKDGNMELEINMITKDGIYWVAKYNSFRVGPGTDNYRLHVSGFSGNATHNSDLYDGDGLSYHDNRQFTTKDADNDQWWTNCAIRNEGAWWYGECGESNLNGQWDDEDQRGIWWDRFNDPNQLRFSAMKFRERA